MSNWVYLFSKFTGEALLFQALAIFLLLGGYAAFWVLRKRRIGAVKETIPTGVVKDYLNVLIADAEQLRAQLFGLLASHGVRLDLPRTTTSVTAVDPALAARAATLEARMAEQATAMENLIAEKTKIEKELVLAKSAASAGASSASGPAPAGSGGSDPMVPQLQEKISGLEARLAEYSVIEDDLANLKRLQQENAQLKATIAGKGEAIPAVAAAAAATAAPTSTAAASAAASNAAATETPSAEATSAAASAPATAAATATPPPEVAAPVDATASPLGDTPGELNVDFEKAVDQIEQGLQPADAASAAAAPTPATEAAAAAPTAPAAAGDSTSTAASGSIPKTDEDLVAEFEKMLNG